MESTPRSRLREFLDLTLALAIGIILVGLSTGCASHAKISASNEIATAQFAIRDAQANGAETLAPDPYRKANELLAKAREQSGYDAERAAASAVAYAQLSSTIAQRENARKQLRDARKMEQEAEALRVRTTNAVEDRLQ
jgi:hypothetical protein